MKAVVYGYERGGTSLIAELLRQHPALDGGFEGGFLLGKKPMAVSEGQEFVPRVAPEHPGAAPS